MPYHLELGSEGHSFHGKAIVVNSQTGEHKSHHPIPMEDAKAQMRVLEGVASHESAPEAPKVRRVLGIKKPKASEASEEEPSHMSDVRIMIEKIKSFPTYADGTYIEPASFVNHVEDLMKKHHLYKEAEHIHKLGQEMPDLLYKKKTKTNLTASYKPVIAFLKTVLAK